MNILMSYMANQKRNKFNKKHLNNFSLAFELAKINLGSTKENPSVGCVVEKNGSIISSGYTSIDGRPHAEYNALKKNLNYKDSNIYITLEPCSHYGKTPPCTNIIQKRGIKKVFFAINDFDERSKNKSTKILLKKKILTYKLYPKERGIRFYESYGRLKKKSLPLIDAKIALSNDYYTCNRKKKWITNNKSRNLAHLLRTKYHVLISTSQSINNDNSLLNCRIEGLTNKSPDLVILDRNLSIKKNLSIFKMKNTRKILIYTSTYNKKKIKWLKNKKIKVILMKEMNSREDYIKLFKSLIKMNYSRVLVESGLTFTNFLIKKRLIDNIYIFKTINNLNNNGFNNSSSNLLKKIKLKNKLKVNLDKDNVYFERLK